MEKKVMSVAEEGNNPVKNKDEESEMREAIYYLIERLKHFQTIMLTKDDLKGITYEIESLKTTTASLKAMTASLHSQLQNDNAKATNTLDTLDEIENTMKACSLKHVSEEREKGARAVGNMFLIVVIIVIVTTMHCCSKL